MATTLIQAMAEPFGLDWGSSWAQCRGYLARRAGEGVEGRVEARNRAAEVCVRELGARERYTRDKLHQLMGRCDLSLWLRPTYLCPAAERFGWVGRRGRHGCLVGLWLKDAPDPRSPQSQSQSQAQSQSQKRPLVVTVGGMDNYAGSPKVDFENQLVLPDGRGGVCAEPEVSEGRTRRRAARRWAHLPLHAAASSLIHDIEKSSTVPLHDVLAAMGTDYVDVLKLGLRGVRAQYYRRDGSKGIVGQRPPFGQICLELHGTYIRDEEYKSSEELRGSWVQIVPC